MVDRPWSIVRTKIARPLPHGFNRPSSIVGPYCDCCSDCTDDPAWTCSYTGEDQSVSSVYIANAHKGDLLLTPGGSMGTIGGLLHQLAPPQHFSHIGIMVADHTLIRHCTANQDRLTAAEYYTGSVSIGAVNQPAPNNGLNRQHLRYAWPGAITQSVEQAYYADRYHDTLPGKSLTAGPNYPTRKARKETLTGSMRSGSTRCLTTVSNTLP
jgi:hypothetical protein